MQGYKTFANRTLFEFAERVTAIVGPNGSGKSNVADSMRWVLGEQSYALLRGKKTEDMIFSGSEHRSRAGMASATITFDNSDGWLPIDFSEVAITRRAYRDGTNEYLINGQRSRLRDVSELLAQSGLAERTYTIIGQGLVDAALALKAEDRRRLFEEAAGIGLYRVRKEEALRRLETTRHNLERAQDILAELEPRLRSLERQARRAKEYDQLTTDLRLLLRDYYGYHWRKSQQDVKQAHEAARKQEKILTEARLRHTTVDEKLSAERDRIQSLRASLNSWHRQSAQQHSRREALSRELAVSGERLRSMELQRQNLSGEQSRLLDEIELQTDQYETIQAELQRLEQELSDANDQVDIARQMLVERQQERLKVEQELQAHQGALERANLRQEQLRSRHAERLAQAETSLLQVERMQNAIQAAKKDVDQAQVELEVEINRQSEAEAVLQGVEEQLRIQRQRQEQVGAAQRSTIEQLAEISAGQARLEMQLAVLDQAEEALKGYANGTQILLQAARQARLEGTPEILSRYLDVPPELEPAITAALGEYLDAVLIKESPDAALDLLEQETARGVLLPLNSLKPAAPLSPFSDGELTAILVGSELGWVGVAADLVKSPLELRPVIDLLLGAVWVVRDRQSARRILSYAIEEGFPGSSAGMSPWTLRVVTLKGEVFYASGPVISSGLSQGETRSTLLGRLRQRRELRKQLEQTYDEQAQTGKLADKIEAEVATLSEEAERLEQIRQLARNQMDQLAQALRQARLKLDRAEQQMGWQVEQYRRLQDEIAQLEVDTRKYAADLDEVQRQVLDYRDRLREKSSALAGLLVDELQENLGHWTTQAAVIGRALGDEKRRQQERKAASDKSKASANHLEVRMQELESDIKILETAKVDHRQEEGEIAHEIETLSRLIEPAEAELEKLEQEVSSLEAGETVARQALSQADHQHAQTRILLARQQESMQALRRRIEDDFGLVAFEYAEQVTGPTPLPLEGMVEQLPKVLDLSPELEDVIRRQRAQLRRMGPINPEAQAEYREVNDRFAFITEQMADLRHAETDIRQVINELDSMMAQEFHKTFDAVAAEFKSAFHRLFTGGAARLVLVDPDNPAESGIDIEARLPGRRTQGLSLLSGGERSLTATALIFALLKVSPTPFCVLDEVDAMLDEANIGRFSDLLTELSDKTQFVVVTHNRNTVQAADVIYGVTMGHDSVSQVISLKLGDVSTIKE
jgi:chromosome segregation protein